MRVKKSFILIYLYTFIILFLNRPGLLAEDYAPLGAFFTFFIGMIYFFLFKIRFVNLRNFIILNILMLFFIFILIHSYILGNIDSRSLNTSLLAFLTLIGFYILTLKDKINFYIFKFFIYTLLLFSFSSIITVLLLLIFNVDSLLLFDIPLTTYNDSTGQFLIPFSNIYGMRLYDYFGLSLPRFSFAFRESGISAIFLIWAYFSLSYYGLNNLINKVVLVISLLLTASTAGISIFIFLLILDSFFNKNKVSFMSYFLILLVTNISIIIISYVMYLFNFFGLLDKLEAGSFFDRYNNSLGAIKILIENPFGIGLFNSPLEMSQINLIAVSAEIGSIGILILIILYIYIISSSKCRFCTFKLVFPFLISWIFFQPLLSATIMFMILFQKINFKVDNEKSINS